MNIPRLRFANLPTPIEALPRLTTSLGGPSIWIKRDDLTGLAMGGNKTRKLEYLLAAAQAHGARTLITTGAPQSNHCRQTAAAAARYGFKCILILAGEERMPLSGNRLLDQILGAEVIQCAKGERDEVLKAAFDRSWESGERPYLIPYGGSNEIGATAYIAAMKELREQDPAFDWIVFATSSGGTQAGMIVGADMVDFPGRILGISVDEASESLTPKIDRLVNDLREYHHLPQIRHTPILVKSDYLGLGYGMPTNAEDEAIYLFARQEGILLDPVYTSRAAAGMIDLIRRGEFRVGERILFWHTGGIPALFAEPYMARYQS